MKDLRNHFTSLLDWIGAGEEVVITRRGKVIATLVPEQAQASSRVDWSQSPAVGRNRMNARVISANESAEIVHDAAGRW